MPWVRFTRPYNWKPRLAVTVAYEPGDYLVTRACAARATVAGAAVRLAKGFKGNEQTAGHGSDFTADSPYTGEYPGADQGSSAEER